MGGSTWGLVVQIAGIVLTAIITALVEHFIGLFLTRSNQQLTLARIGKLFIRWAVIFSLIFLMGYIYLINFVHFFVVLPDQINGRVMLVSGIASLLLACAWVFGWVRGWVRKVASKRIGLWRFALTPWLLVIPGIFAVSWGTVAASPSQIILVMPTQGSDTASSMMAEELRLILSQTTRNDIEVRNFVCLGACPRPESVLGDPRIRLVIASEINERRDGDQIQVTLFSHCRDDKALQTESPLLGPPCRASFDFPFDNFYQTHYLDSYLPVFLLSTVSVSNQAEAVTSLTRRALITLDYAASTEDRAIILPLYRKLFFDILFNTPSLSRAERVGFSGEIFAAMEPLVSDETEKQYLLGLYYEVGGSHDQANYLDAIDKYQTVLHQRPDDPNTLQRLSVISAAIHRPLDAICYLTHAQTLAPSDQKALMLANLYEQISYAPPSLDTPAVAVPSLNQSAQDLRSNLGQIEDPTSARDYLALAEVALLNADFDTALAYSQRVQEIPVATRVEVIDAIFLEGRIYSEQSDPIAAMRTFHHLLSLIDKETVRPQLLMSGYHWLAISYRSSGDHERASETFALARDVAVSAEERAMFIAKMAEEEKSAGNLQESERLFARALDYFEASGINTAGVPLERREVYVQTRYEAAALEDNPEQSQAHYQYVADYYTQLIARAEGNSSKDFAGCEWLMFDLQHVPSGTFDHLMQYHDRPVLPASYYQMRRSAYRQLGDNTAARADAALEVARRSLTLITAVDYYNLGLALRATGSYTEAITAQEQAIRRDNPDTQEDLSDATDYYEIGENYLALGQHEEAMTAFARAVELQVDPLDAATYNSRLGAVYMEVQDFTAAIDQYEKALSNRSAEDHYNMAFDNFYIGEAHYKLGVRDENIDQLRLAIQAYTRAAQVMPAHQSNAWIWYNVGIANRAAAELTRGTAFFNAAVEAWMHAINNDNPEATRTHRDTSDVADWYQIAKTYHMWATIDPSKLELSRLHAERAISIPIDPVDSDFQWHQQAQALLAELDL